jgi:MtfA peptidase
LLLIIVLIILFILSYRMQNLEEEPLRHPAKPKVETRVLANIPEEGHETLKRYIPVYQSLSGSHQQLFRNKMKQFIERVQLFPIDFELVDRDYLFVSASAVLPVFTLDDWLYPNLNIVVLHQHTMDSYQDKEGNHWSTAGMFDYSRAPDTLHIARNVLWYDFINDTPANVALHEFMHCIDSNDRSIDGIPLLLLDKQYITPWVELMVVEIKNIVDKKSSINPYAAESNAEFLATVSEFYFKQPYQFQQQHPNLFAMMQKIFKHDGSS